MSTTVHPAEQVRRAQARVRRLEHLRAQGKASAAALATARYHLELSRLAAARATDGGGGYRS